MLLLIVFLAAVYEFWQALNKKSLNNFLCQLMEPVAGDPDAFLPIYLTEEDSINPSCFNSDKT